MDNDGTGNKQHTNKETLEKEGGDKLQSVYLWKGFSQPVSIVTFDVFAGVEIVDVSVGKEHSLFLTTGGVVYAQGSNGCGQLGLGSSDVSSVSEPVKVDGIKDHVIQVSCGQYHSAAVCHDGRVMCWGDSSEGQCGTGSLDIVTFPTPVIQDIPSGFCKEHGHPKPPIHVLFESVSCGGQHTLAISTDGEVWTWGCGKQLGLGDLLHAPIPRCIETLKGKTVLSVFCGEKHSLALVMKGDNNNKSSKSPHSSSPHDKNESKGEKPTAMSKSPSVTDVTIDKHFPSRCNSCQKEIFTYTDVSDMCIIETDHDCHADAADDCGPRRARSGAISDDGDDGIFVDDPTMMSGALPSTSSSNDGVSSNRNMSDSQDKSKRIRSSSMISPPDSNVSSNVNNPSKQEAYHDTVKIASTNEVDGKDSSQEIDPDSENNVVPFDSPDKIHSPGYMGSSPEPVLSPITSPLVIDKPIVHDDGLGEGVVGSNLFGEDAYTDCLSDVPDTTMDSSVLVLPPPSDVEEEEEEERDCERDLPVLKTCDNDSSFSNGVNPISAKASSPLKSEDKEVDGEGLAEMENDSSNSANHPDYNQRPQTGAPPSSPSSVARDGSQSVEEAGVEQPHEMKCDSGGDKSAAATTREKDDYSRSASQDSDGQVWKRQSASEDLVGEVVLDHPLSQSQDSIFPRARSPSGCSVKSLQLNQSESEAMQYLRRQFEEGGGEEEEVEAARRARDRRARSSTNNTPSASRKGVGGGGGGAAGGKDSVLSGLGLATTSSPSALMKSITNRAMSSLQSLSVFGTAAVTTATTAATTTTPVTASTPSSSLSSSSSKPTPPPPTSSSSSSSDPTTTAWSSVEMVSFVSPTVSSPEIMDDDGDGKSAAAEVFSSPESCSLISSVSSLTAEATTPQSPHEDIRNRAFKSGTFIEWRKEMSSIDGDHVTSLSADKDPNSLRSLRTIEHKKRNLSSTSSPVAKDNQVSPHRQVVTTTEVWAWGHNVHGQLGLGDTIDRTVPVWLKHFSGRNVKKLAAGDSHSLALIDNSQVYSWGSNSHGQLGQNKSTDFPTRLKFQGGNAVWDIAAGTHHSLLMVDTSFYRPDVFYCGKQPSNKANASMKKASDPTAVSTVRERASGWMTGLHAGGSSCACQVWNLQDPLATVVFELASTERTLYSQLIKTSNLLLRPLKKSTFYSSMDVYPYKPALQNVIASFGVLTTKVGKGVVDLTATIQHRRNPKEARLVCEHRDFQDMFRTYSQVFSDFLSIGGFEYCTKTGSQFFSEIQGNVQALSGEKDKSATASSLFLRAMTYPFYRLSSYSRIFSKMADAAETQEDRVAFENTKLDWDSLKSYLSSEHKLADTTKAFWESSNARLADALRSTSRRLLKESKSHPLSLVSASRFSSASFILFNDMFVYSQNNSLTTYRLETLWVEAVDSPGNGQNHIIVTTPEERLELSTPNASVKAEWLMSLQSAISKAVTSQKGMSSPHASGERFTPPNTRHATHTFTKQCLYKDATYKGTWLSGKVHGMGEMKWSDGSVFKGNFKRGLMHGHGTYAIVKAQGKEVQKGVWKDGKLNGHASIVYANGDLYEGYLKDGHRFGHGMLQMGRFKSNCASVYIGEWTGNQRHGFGVEDHILKGEKYMGAWSEDCRHGNGIMVTLDGMYFEGTFVNNKMTGFGVMISDDDTLYEGDFMGITHLSGKGTLTLPQGDKLEGSFSGSLNDGLKVNGTFSKAATGRESFSDPHATDRLAPAKSKYFGRLCVQADAKWTDIFSHVSALLGQGQGQGDSPGGAAAAAGGGGGGGSGVGQRSRVDTEKAWEVVAVLVSEGLKALKEKEGSKAKLQRNHLQGLELIPNHRMGELDTVKVAEMSQYLEKAFESSHHPLGQLMNMLVDVFRASYIGVGAHPRLLHHAVHEIRSYIRRIYKVLRLLFPALPESGYTTYFPPSHQPKTEDPNDQFADGLETEDPETHILTAAGVLYPILLPKVYPPLFDLYALYNERSDDRYWERVTKLNRQGDVGLMAYLGIEQQFWLVDEILAQDSSKTLSSIKEECYAQAVDQLQQLSTAFSPLEKLTVIKEAFNEITKTVMASLGDEVMWCMDDLFPIFQFVVVRAKIHHLGAEIHLIEDLMEQHMEHGEYGLMFTTLTACYFQIQNEKMPHH